MKVHFIAIGGAAMHNLALALHQKGFTVTGSDDEIFEPSRGRLDRAGLLPSTMGWDPARITTDLDAVILGMHAREHNPELARARELGLTIYSYPEYLYEQSKDKQRVVIGGSHGKTSITAMMLHVLQGVDRPFDYMVGAQLDGFETMVQLSEAPLIVLEGDEYLSSPLDRRPKFHLYQPHIALLTGIAWDHINVFPTFDNYVEQFRIFLDKIEPNGTIVYYEGDPILKELVESHRPDLNRKPYTTPKHTVEEGISTLDTETGAVPLKVFGDHNLQNLEGARLVCEELGIEATAFYQAIRSFTGAAKRLEKIGQNEHTAVFKDFAHSPSKLKATTAAVKRQYPNRHLVACMELHTFSSLTGEFLLEYKGAMAEADTAVVYFNHHTLEHKKLPPISPEQVRAAFDRDDLTVMTDSDAILAMIRGTDWPNKNLLLMSSGNFDGIDMNALAKELTS